jgi:hypothetical protein
MGEDLLFLSESQRKKLQEAYALIASVSENVHLGYEEHSILYTTLDALKRTIEYEEKYY